ncbi:MAG TPA: hypothetical protein VM925_14775 [Labilithrix sp.]|nr:hypothetical protein [Labilithrix sp.]
MSKPLRAGGEVDSWCTKCKLVLNHRIIAMVGGTPVRVECSTCMSHHNFRARAPGDKAPAAGVTRKVSSASTSGPRSTRSSVTKAQQAALDREKSWEKAIAGKAVSDFKNYRVDQLFSEGDLIRHKKFGDGVVTRILDPKKVEILFKDEPRTLAQGLTD